MSQSASESPVPAARASCGIRISSTPDVPPWDRPHATAQLESEDINPEGLDHYGDTLWRLQKTDAAIGVWERAISLAEDEGYQSLTMQGYVSYQQQVWGIVLVTPRSIFDRIHDERISTLRAKLAAATREATRRSRVHSRRSARARKKFTLIGNEPS